MMTDDLCVTHPREFQGITLWLGGGTVISVDDRSESSVLRSATSTLQRAVAVARLRAVADMLDDSHPSNALGLAAARLPRD